MYSLKLGRFGKMCCRGWGFDGERVGDTGRLVDFG